ncbi:LOW QUALITY PROTEIN: dynamin-binding protein-like [Pristis pectinata]|uniref:LOW QUALITY PROTEIN: dynamin-binding protein-like n=1 Tax=Pristis pectinata TaxID=685728 RepID=UPI00223E5134|nr:LOW QUALITY PROTEIN: dynamin-binding protein-like [Pristis pectinata]
MLILFPFQDQPGNGWRSGSLTVGMEPGSLVRAIFEFCPSVSEELPIFGGDVIEVLSVVDEFWLLGKKDGVTGQFPSSFVEPVCVPNTKPGERLCVCTDDFRASASSDLPLKRGDVVVVEDTLDGNWLRGRTSWGSLGAFPASCIRELSLSCRARELSLKALGELPAYGLGRARALMGLSAQLPEELDFTEGDVITIVGLPEPGWFEGELEGRRGVFPEGFVELLGPLQSPKTGARGYEGEGEEEEEEEEEEVPVEEEEEEVPVEEEVVEDPEEPTRPGLYGVAMYDFQALEADELDFSKGDRIRITGTLEDGWLQGTLAGRTGIFPVRFVRLQGAGGEHPGLELRERAGLAAAGSATGCPPSPGQQDPADLRPGQTCSAAVPGLDGTPCLPSLPAVAAPAEEGQGCWGELGSEEWASQGHQGSEGWVSGCRQGSEGWDSQGQQGLEGRGSWSQQGSEGWGSKGQQGSEVRKRSCSALPESASTMAQSNGWVPVHPADGKAPSPRGGPGHQVVRADRRVWPQYSGHQVRGHPAGPPTLLHLGLYEPTHPRCPPRVPDTSGSPLEAEGDSGPAAPGWGPSPRSLHFRMQETDWDPEVQTHDSPRTTSQEILPSGTTENLEFYSYNIRTLEGEFQTLKDMTLLSTDHSSLEAPPVSATAEKPEHKMMEKRAKVIEELLQTEADYIKDLEMCVEKVLVPLQAKRLQQVDCEALFGNIQTVIEVSRRLHEELEETDSIGQVFLSYRNELQDMYNVYCQNHEEAIALLETYEKDKEIQGHVNACLDHLRAIYRQWGKTNYINLGSFLIKPVQRVMRYPLLLSELLNTTPERHHDKKPLEEAVLAVKELNANINEYKRRKDLVLKYRKGDEDSLMDKISKLSMHSIIKKSNRVSSHLKHLTGLAPQIRNEAFEEVERRFREQERLIKNFIRDLSLYLQHLRDSASVKVLAAMSILDMYGEKSHTNLEHYQQAHRLISDSLFNDFKERTERLVIDPLTQLLGMCAGPHKLMIKRFDKLLDYHNCKERAEKLKDKRTLEELQAAKNNYEALNAQLLDDMPRFHKSTEELFISCVQGFAEAHRDFVGKTLEGLLPLSQLISVVSKDTTIVASFQEQHNKAMQLLQVFSFFPDTLPSSRKPFERKTTERQSSRWQMSAMPMATFQTAEQRANLLAKYEPEKLYQADRNFNAAQELDVSLLEGDLIGVIKQQDPMGSQNRWLVDNGVMKGFVYSSFLKPYNSRCSHSDISVGSQSSNESGYGGSSPVISRQNSTSVLAVNHSSGTVSYSSPPPRQTASPPRADPSPRQPAPTQRSYTFEASSAPSCEQPRDSHPAGQPRRSSQMEYSLPRKNRECRQVLRRASSQEGYLESNNFDPGQQVYYAGLRLQGPVRERASPSPLTSGCRSIRFHDMSGNPDWWLAEANGRRGYVPATYIRKTEYT